MKNFILISLLLIPNVAVSDAVISKPTPSSLVPPSSNLSANQKAFHLLNRLAYGPRPGDLETLSASGNAGMDAWLEQQLHPESISDTEVDQKLLRIKSLSMTIDQLREAYPKPDRKNKKKKGETDTEFESSSEKNPPPVPPTAVDVASDEVLTKLAGNEMLPRRMLIELISARLVRAVESKRQFQEVILDFWFNHFNVDFKKGQVKWYLTSYERDTLRPHLFGKFRDLLGSVAKSPAMLFYLDNFQSVKDGLQRPRFMKAGATKTLGLNENYGRELLELHTLGVDGGYTQQDVRETARALTGWSLEQPQRSTEFKFRKRAHDEDEKHILGVVFPAQGGITDGEKVLDLLARSPKTAHFIAQKLCIKFISDHPPESAVQKVQAAFQKSDGDLRVVYTTLFHLPEFWAAASVRSKIKTPWEFEVSAARALGAQVVLTPKGPKRMLMSLNQMGEPLYNCQPPTGFKATSEYWVNPGALVSRINLGLQMAGDRLPEINFDRTIFRNKLQAAKIEGLDPVISELNQWMLAGEMKTNTRKHLVKELQDEQGILNDAKIPVVNLAKLSGLILGSPEFQRR
jgi:uncharacterized protein (DUF1800 family)